MEKVLFIDRDGTLVKETDNEQLDSFEKLNWMPGVFTYLSKIYNELDYTLVMVTNQDGLGTDIFPENTFYPVHNHVMSTLEGEGIPFAEVLIDRSFPRDKKPTRKPGTGMLTHYMTGKYDLPASFVIGDRFTDVELAKNLGTRAIFIHEGGPRLGQGETAHSEEKLKELIGCETDSWKVIYEYLYSLGRTTTVSRKTSETDIFVKVNLDGSGKSDIHTGLPFFDHMLEQIAKHGMADLEIKVKGDLQVDEHHTIEDTALALGEAFAKALGKKVGLERYGFSLPMDDSLASVALDFGGRPWIVWEAEFKREKIGDVPTEMFFHFFKSFSDAAKCNLNIKVEGDNEHHKIEAIFKAFARAIKMAVKRDRNVSSVPSTKGTL